MTCEDLGCFHNCTWSKKKILKKTENQWLFLWLFQKINDFSQTLKNLSHRGNCPLEICRDWQILRVRAEICLPVRVKLVGTRKWQFWQSVEAACGSLHFYGVFSPGTPDSHSEEPRKIFLLALRRKEEKIIIVKYAQIILLNKGPLSKAKGFARASSYWEWYFTLVFLNHQSQGEKAKTHLWRLQRKDKDPLKDWNLIIRL